jgi:hypothetical protein
VVCTPHKILFRLSNQKERVGWGMWQFLEIKYIWLRFQKKELHKYRRRWHGNIKMNLTEMRWDDVHWIHQSRD